ncbi:hypothetical protein L9F63_022881, partial [Diploptera punctata]
MRGGGLFCAIILLLMFITTCLQTDDNRDSNLLSRRRRYVVFPEGSTFSIAFCVMSFLAYDNSNIYTMGLNWAVSYELPNETIRSPETNRIVPPPLLRRHRRELYESLEMAVAGLDGRSCIKRALCEAHQHLKPESTVFEEVLRVIFTFPEESVGTYEPLEHHIYDAAYRRGLSKKPCITKYKNCPFSLLHMLLLIFVSTDRLLLIFGYYLFSDRVYWIGS